MYEILDKLRAGESVLDFCAGNGSFPAGEYKFRTVRVDRELAKESISEVFTQANATALPFKSQSFDAVIANHALEHLHPLKPALQEMGRVVKKTGWAYISVPDARTFSDRLYRKVFKNRGGHVNLFDSAERLSQMLEWYLGLRHLATIPLYSSYSYLNSANYDEMPQKRAQLRLPPLSPELLLWMNVAMAYADAWLNTKCNLYGWAFYFGPIGCLEKITEYRNVCVRCGSGIRVSDCNQRQRKLLGLGLLICPVCGGCAVDRSRLMG